MHVRDHELVRLEAHQENKTDFWSTGAVLLGVLEPCKNGVVYSD